VNMFIPVLIAAVTLAMTVSCLMVGFVCAFWKTKASLLGARPGCGIVILYKASAVLSVSMALLLLTPFGLLSTVPGMIVGATVALLDVVKMNDDDRQRFLRANSGRYSDPIGIVDARGVKRG
jgi:hypothetical protein